MSSNQLFRLAERAKSFGHAFDGIAYVFKSQDNFRIHLAVATVVILLAYVLEVNIIEWCFLISCIACVLVCETFNTALESLTDLVSPDYHPLAKIAKDASAGAVLLASTASAAIGLIIFIPKIIGLYVTQ